MTENERKVDPFEAETCEGCRYYETRSESSAPGVTILRQCLNPEMRGERGWPDLHDQCDVFEPSLLCRGVRAAEDHNDLDRRKVEALEKLATTCTSAAKRTCSTPTTIPESDR